MTYDLQNKIARSKEMKRKKKKRAEEKVSHGALTPMRLLAECEQLCRQSSIIAYIIADLFYTIRE